MALSQRCIVAIGDVWWKLTVPLNKYDWHQQKEPSNCTCSLKKWKYKIFMIMKPKKKE